MLTYHLVAGTVFQLLQLVQFHDLGFCQLLISNQNCQNLHYSTSKVPYFSQNCSQLIKWNMKERKISILEFFVSNKNSKYSFQTHL